MVHDKPRTNIANTKETDFSRKHKMKDFVDVKGSVMRQLRTIVAQDSIKNSFYVRLDNRL